MNLDNYKASLKKCQKALKRNETYYFDIERLVKYCQLYNAWGIKKEIKAVHKILANFIKKENCSILENRNDKIVLTSNIGDVAIIIKYVSDSISLFNKLLVNILNDKELNETE